MNTKVLKRFASAIAAMSVASAGIGAFAADEEAEIIQINKPYLNITVTADESLKKLPNGLELKLVGDDGSVAAQWTVGSEAEATTADGIYNITSETDFSKLPVDPFVPEIKNGELYSSDSEDAIELSSDGYNLQLNGKYTYEYTVIEGLTGETMTLDAGTWAVAVDDAYNDDKAIAGVTGVWFNDHAGETVVNDDLSIGDHDVFINRKSGGSSGGTLKIMDHETTYVKVTGNIADLSHGYFNEDGTFAHTHESDGETHYMRLGDVYDGDEGDIFDEHYIIAYFISGGVVSAVLPDDDGNISIWVSEETLTYGLATGIHCEFGNGGGGRNGSTVGGITPIQVACAYSTEFSVPATGLTLYDIPAGKYTVTTDSTEYVLENAVITVTNTKDLQSADITVKKAEVKPNDSKKPGNNDSDTNPKTGVATGSAALIVTAAAALVISKKNK